MKFNLETFLSDLTYNTRFEILEESKNKKELIEIAEKKGIKLPAHDLSIFKGIYAYVDRMNKNQCTLPKEEVEKALITLSGKAIDFDHFRKKVVGYWIDAKIEGDEIIAYGIFFKGNFKEDYEVIKELMEKDVLAISFEAWGDREFKEDGSYNLRGIEFAGGALLLKSQPAFPGSEVLEMAKNRVLEFASVMTKPETFTHEKKDLEEARYYIYDTQAIMQSLSEVECGSCGEKYTQDVMMMDYENNKAKTKCIYCGAEMMVNFTPESKLTKKGRKVKKLSELSTKGQIENVEEYIKEFEGSDIWLETLLEQSVERPLSVSYEKRLELTDEDFAAVTNINNRKIRIFPIHDLAHIIDVEARLEQCQVEALMGKLGVKKDNVKRKVSRRKINLAMKELLEKFKKGTAQEVIQEVAKISLGRELTKEELEKAYSILEYKAQKPAGLANNLTLTGLPNQPANENKSYPASAPSNETSLQTAEVSEEDVKNAIIEATKKAEEATKVDVKDTEITQLKTQLGEVAKKLEEATKELTDFRKAKEDAEKAARDTKIKSRKDELGEFGKDMKDEDILDELKYENAKLKKENADLKAGKKPETAAIVTTTPEIGAGDKNKTPVTESAQKVQTMFLEELGYTEPEKK